LSPNLLIHKGKGKKKFVIEAARVKIVQDSVHKLTLTQ